MYIVKVFDRFMINVKGIFGSRKSSMRKDEPWNV